MDEADRAQVRIESELEAAIAAARGIPPARPRGSCCDCAEPLGAHRVGYGICVRCQQRRESLQRLRGRR